MWMKYLDMEPNMFHREDHYFAQMSSEIRRSFVKHPKKVKLKDFLINFTFNKPPDNLSPEIKIQRSKSFWRALTGMNNRDQ